MYNNYFTYIPLNGNGNRNKNYQTSVSFQVRSENCANRVCEKINRY